MILLRSGLQLNNGYPMPILIAERRQSAWPLIRPFWIQPVFIVNKLLKNC